VNAEVDMLGKEKGELMDIRNALPVKPSLECLRKNVMSNPTARR
jgi:hypothetical protein